MASPSDVYLPLGECLALIQTRDKQAYHATYAFLSFYRRTSSPRKVFRKLWHDIQQRTTSTGHKGAVLRFLSIWIEARFAIDFRSMQSPGTRKASPQTSSGDLIDTGRFLTKIGDFYRQIGRQGDADLLTDLTRVNLSLVRQLAQLKRNSRVATKCARPIPHAAAAATATRSPASTKSAPSVLSSSPAASASPFDVYPTVVRYRLTPSLVALAHSADMPTRPLTEDDRKLRRLMAYSPQCIAEHLTAIDFAAFCDVQTSEFYGKAWETTAMANSTVKAFTERWNRIALWTTSNILVQKTLASQARVFCGFIRIAKWCHELGNYSGALAIFNGASAHVVARLFRCWRENEVKIGNSYKRLYYFLEKLLAASDGFSSLRADLATRARDARPCVPHLGLFQRDLTLIHEGNHDLTQDGHLNMSKLSMVINVLEQIRVLQKRHYPPPSKQLPLLDRMLLRLICCGDAEGADPESVLSQLSAKWRPLPKDPDVSETIEQLSSVDDRTGSEAYDDAASGSSVEELVDVSDFSAVAPN